MRPGERDEQTERPTDAGYTLIEMLISIILMGTIVMAIMGGMWAVVRASCAERRQGQGAGRARCGRRRHHPTTATSTAPRSTTATSEFGQKAAAAVGWPASTVHIIAYKYWNPDTNTWDPTNSIQGTACNQGRRAHPVQDTAEADHPESARTREWLHRHDRHREGRHSCPGGQRCLVRLLKTDRGSGARGRRA